MVRRQTGDRPTRIAILAAALVVALTLPLPPARALTGTDGLIAIATSNGIEVFVSSGDGSDRQVLIANETPGVFDLEDPAWSPTGALLAYEHEGGVWVARADGADAHRVSPSSEYALDPAWSPDGRIAYLSYGSTVVIIDADGTHRVVLNPRKQLGRPNVYTIWRPTWTADGRLVVLLAEPGEMAETPFIADGDGTNLRPLTYPDGTTPDSSDLSDNWQFSSTGLVAFVAFVPEDNYRWVDFSTFDGTYIVEAPFDVGADLGSRDDVALSPSGQRAVITWPGFTADPFSTGVSIWDVNLTSSSDSLNGTGGFEMPGEVAGLDWQPRCSITGTPGDDELTGTRGPDLICGLGGDDVISGMGGNDVIYAGPGEDAILGGAGNDVVVGGWGADTIEGNRGLDLINSRRDAYSPDSVHGGLGHDVCLHDRADVLASC